MPIVSLKQLADLHNINRVLIRKTIAENPDFPYTPCPENNPMIGHKFDTDAVDAWLLVNDWARGNTQYHPEIHERLDQEAAEKLEKQAAAGITVTHVPASVQRLRDAKAGKNNKSDVQTALLQLELDKKRSLLVPRDEVINEFAPMIVGLAKGLEQMPNLIGKRHGLSDEVIRDIRDHIDQLRETLVRAGNQGILNENYVLVEEKDE